MTNHSLPRGTPVSGNHPRSMLRRILLSGREKNHSRRGTAAALRLLPPRPPLWNETQLVVGARDALRGYSQASHLETIVLFPRQDKVRSRRSAEAGARRSAPERRVPLFPRQHKAQKDPPPPI